MIKYYCSNGDRVSQATINRRLSQCYRKMGNPGFPSHRDHDHTISQARCKQLHKTELIWDQYNIEFSERQTHTEWESYRSGSFEEHSNVIKRMLFVKKHDREGFMKRFLCLSNYKVMEAVK